MPILSIAMACGYESASHFSKSYNEHFGCTPSTERRRPSAQLTRAEAPAHLEDRRTVSFASAGSGG